MLVGEKRMRDLPMALVLEQLTNELGNYGDSALN